MNKSIALLLVFLFGSLGFNAHQNEVKIVGGTPAYPGEFPYQVSIRSEVESIGHICGGAILSPNLIITAGACVDPRSPAITQIVAGTLFLAEPFPGQQIRAPGRIIPHPDYNGTTLQNDLALIFLNESFEFNKYISSIRLPGDENWSAYPDPVLITGWGSEQYGLPLSDFLLKATVDTYSDEECEVWTEQEVPEEILCSGKDEIGHGGCIGDAGTPIISLHSQHGEYLAAVMSHFPCFTPNCCGRPGPTEQSPELAYYLDWINEQSAANGGGL